MIEVVFKYFWLFVFGSFFGFVIETLWCLLKNKKIESRKGLIYGLFTPIYGVAGALLTIVLDIFNIKSYIWVFVLTFIISAVIEYVSSFMQEKFFGTVSWDYTGFPLNINGRINVVYILAFSIFGLIWVKLYPIVTKFFIPLLKKYKIYVILSISTILYMIYNIFISAAASYRQKLRREGIPAKNNFEKMLDKKYTDEYMSKIYTNAIIVNK